MNCKFRLKSKNKYQEKMTLTYYYKQSLRVAAVLLGIASCSAYSDLSEFFCEKGQAVQVVYHEIDSLKSLPSKSMMRDMFLAYDGECVSQIKYPKSDSPFAGSGKTNNVFATFAGQLEFPKAGTWTMYTKSIDGSKLYINDNLIVNNNGLHKVMVEKSGKIEVTEDTLIQSFMLQYFNGEEGENGLIVKWEGPGRSKSVVKSSDFYAPDSFYLVGLPSVTPLPWKHVNSTRYKTTSRTTLPSNFSTLDLVSRETSYSYLWPLYNCTFTDNFAVVVQGYVEFPEAGIYTIFEKSDGYARLYVDGDLLLTVTGKVGVQDKGQVSISVEKGAIKLFRFEFLELCLGSLPSLYWKGSSGAVYSFPYQQ